MTVGYEQAREIARREWEPGWSVGTFCLDDRYIVYNDEFYVFEIGAREFLVDGDHAYALQGGVPVVYKANGHCRMLPAVEVAMDQTVRRRPNPSPTLHI
jgi:hypothetical protein